MANYITKEIGLDGMSLPPHGITILYSIWEIREKSTGEVVFYDDYDTENITSRIFTNVFELGKTYQIVLSMIRSDGPTIPTEPFEVTISATGDITDKYHLPAVVETPIIYSEYPNDEVPATNAVFTTSPFNCFGNAVHKASNWWLVSDNNKLIWESLDDETNLTKIRLNKLNLKTNKLYTLYNVQKGTNRDTSAAGSYTFTVKEYSELELKSGIDDIKFNMAAKLSLYSVDDAMSEFIWELWGEDKKLILTSTNNTGIVDIPAEINGNYVFNKQDNYTYYNLRIKATINGVEIGWRDRLFNPTDYVIESIVWTKTTNYANKPRMVGVNIPSLGSIENFDQMTGITYQLPDGLVLLPRGHHQYGLYSVSGEGLNYDLVRNVVFTGMNAENINSGKYGMTLRPLDNNKFIFCPDTANTHAYIYVVTYDIVNKTFHIEFEVDLGTSDEEIGYTEYHYLTNDRVLLCTVKDTTDLTNNYMLRVLNTSTGILTEIKSSSHTPSSLYSMLIRTSSNTFTVVGSTLTDIKSADGRAFSITINPDDTFTATEMNTTLFDSIDKQTDSNIIKRLRSVQLRNGNTLIYTPDYYDKDSETRTSIKYNLVSPEGIIVDKGEILVGESTIQADSQSLGFTIKLNNGTIVLLNGKSLFAVRYLAR